MQISDIIDGKLGPRYFGWQYGNGDAYHNGIDIMATAGKEVYAPCGMKVIENMKSVRGYGDSRGATGMLILLHAKIDGIGVVTFQLGHVVSTLRKGQYICKGKQIGQVNPYTYYQNGTPCRADHVHLSINYGTGLPTKTYGYVRKNELDYYINPKQILGGLE